MKILVQKSSDKFICNLDSLKNNHDIFFSEINNDIYRIYAKINPDVYIFVSENMGYEEIHFCNNITDKKIIVYNTSDNIVNLPKHIKNINRYTMPLLYNEQRFFNLQNTNRNIEFSYFLDYDSEIGEKLSKQIYPNTKKQILLFNNSKIKHPQNMGTLTEDEKAFVLNDTKNFICNDMNYAIEAYRCGCRVFDLDLKEIDCNNIDYLTYSDYIETIL